MNEATSWLNDLQYSSQRNCVCWPRESAIPLYVSLGFFQIDVLPGILKVP